MHKCTKCTLALLCISFWLGVLFLIIGGALFNTFDRPRPNGDEYILFGGLTHNSIIVSIKHDNKPKNPVLTVSNAAFSAGITETTTQITISGLIPNARYDWTFKDFSGSFVTPPAPGTPFNFTFAASACSQSGSENPVFGEIAALNPFFFLHMGDIEYYNVGENNQDLFRKAFKTAITSESQTKLYHSCPLVYIWDDHDFGPNDSDKTNPGKPAAHAVFREIFPSYVTNPAPQPINQAFTIGTIRFILTDLRSEKDPAGSDGSAMGADTKAWFKSELLASKDNHTLIFWVSSYAWISDSSFDSIWGGYPTERKELSDFIVSNGIHTKLVTLGGDAHMLGFDDGTHNTFSTAGTKGWPVFQVAALDRIASVKGGPYSHGCHTEMHQFGTIGVTVLPNNQTCLNLSGYVLDTKVWSYDTCNPTTTSLGECKFSSSKKIAQGVRFYRTPVALFIIGIIFAGLCAPFFLIICIACVRRHK